MPDIRNSAKECPNCGKRDWSLTGNILECRTPGCGFVEEVKQPQGFVHHNVDPAKVGIYEHRRNQGIVGVEDPKADHPVHHPNHYTAYKGLEIIDLTEQMNFNRGNAVKYIARAGLKNKDTEIQDLQKAAWYINREIERLENES